ncbi:MAG: phage terminase small subunit P27 family [Planctomycetes bacterium]|nr:phage terminase small subunit P27 family [Planctomycetota bacterium]
MRGSKLVTKRRNQTEAKGPEGTPACPEWLDADGRLRWAELVPQLEAMGVLTLVDQGAVARYCHLWARWRKAEEFIAQHGEMYPLKDDKGRTKCVQPWPQVATANKLALQLTRLEQEFGLTPAARTRIHVTRKPANNPDNPKLRFFQAPA